MRCRDDVTTLMNYTLPDHPENDNTGHRGLHRLKHASSFGARPMSHPQKAP